MVVVSDWKKVPRWLWPLGFAVAGLGTVAAVLFRGCWHPRMSWPVRHNEEYSYRVCTDCGAKRLFDHANFREYGPYGYDLEDLIARDRARNIKRIHLAATTAETRTAQEKKEPKRAS